MRHPAVPHLPPGNERVRLFCLPHAGGGATSYLAWRRLLPDGVAVIPLLPPGREGRFREPAHRRFAPLVEELTSAVAPLLDRPWAVFGHSLGALVGFELIASLLRRSLPPPLALFASGARAPSRQAFGGRGLHALSDQGLLDRLTAFGGTPAGVLEHPELRALILPILRADLELFETYDGTAAGRLPTRVVPLGGEEDREVPPAELAFWDAHGASAAAPRVFPGGHFYLQGAGTAPLVTAVGQALHALTG